VSHTCPRIEPRSFTLRPHRETVAAREIRLSGVPRGAVVVLWDGSSLGDADDVLNGLAEHGYESLAADLSGPMQALDDRMGLADAALRHLGANGWEHEQVGIVGYGPGGWLSLQAAAAFRLGAAVSVAPVLPAGHADATAHALTRLRTPWLAMAAERADAGGGFSGLQSLRDRAAVHTEVVCYPAAPPRFYRDSADALTHAAAFDSWQRTIEWLNVRVVPRLTARARAWRAALPPHAGTP
jgi:carboxymethylenebutenolidase